MGRGPFRSLTQNSYYSHRIQKHNQFKNTQIAHTKFKSLTPNSNPHTEMESSQRIQITHTELTLLVSGLVYLLVCSSHFFGPLSICHVLGLFLCSVSHALFYLWLASIWKCQFLFQLWERWVIKSLNWLYMQLKMLSFSNSQFSVLQLDVGCLCTAVFYKLH